MRPKTVAEVAELTQQEDVFHMHLANFLDEFYARPSEAALEPAPDLLAPIYGEEGQVKDAYLAATAEHLAYSYNFTAPAWVGAEERRLHRPWFASSLAGLRTVLLLESPPAFRSRNLFVSENALSRA